MLLRKSFPDTTSISEVSAVLGGRNDLIQYHFNGRKIVFEVFCSPSQVPQDLRLLEQCNADVKIAIILDPDIDESVSTQFFRKKPDAFPYLWLNNVLDIKWEKIIVARLHELIDENNSIVKLRRMLSTKYGNDIDTLIGKTLEQIESKITVEKEPKEKTYSGKEILAYLILKKILEKGIPTCKLRSLHQWLVASIDYGVEVVQSGFKAYLITDLQGRNAIWSAGDFIDDFMIIDEDTINNCQLVLCLNPIINNFFEKIGMKSAEEKFHLYHNYIEFIKKVETVFDLENSYQKEKNTGT
jgi:hypothetical protein